MRAILLFLILATHLHGAGLGVYNPAQHAVNGFMPTQLGAKLWLAANHLCITNNASVADWVDFSGYGNNVTQSTSSQRPTLKNDYKAGRPSVTFDGVDDSLFSTALASSIQNPMTAFVVGLSKSYESYFYDAYTSTSRVAALHNQHFLLIYAGTAEYKAAQTNYSNTNGVFSFAYNGTNSSMFFNSYKISPVSATADVGNNSLHSIRIGSRYNSANFAQGDISELIILPYLASSSQRLQVERYLGTKYGIVVQ